jgi:lipoyl synthase
MTEHDGNGGQAQPVGDTCSQSPLFAQEESAADSRGQRMRMPSWLKRNIPRGGKKRIVESRLLHGDLHTVCVEASCPNRTECYSRGTATFLLMGTQCTRSCAFCGITHATPQPLDEDEPSRVAEAVCRMGLKYVVMTSVTRDDLVDGGASHFIRTIEAVRGSSPQTKIEILVPDFNGNPAALKAVLDSAPDVFNHNMETVPRLYRLIRPQAMYQRSLDVLRAAAAHNLKPMVKSGLMVGLGEQFDEVVAVIHDLHESGCSIVTIGQYLSPSDANVPVKEFVDPQIFAEYARVGSALGIRCIAGPFVRSSYMAEEAYNG